MRQSCITTSGPEETREFARKLAGFLLPGDLVLIEGDLGAGKTTFVQGLAAGLGIDDQVASPTFTLMRIYECGPTGVRRGVARLLHADLYRLEHLREVVDLGLPELLDDAAVAVVEWGEAGAPVLGDDFLEVRIDTADDERPSERVIALRGTSSWSGRVAAMTAAFPDGPGTV
jgi:tRNA threonylcarbamoyladenosine biosynthesis protein TsaE